MASQELFCRFKCGQLSAATEYGSRNVSNNSTIEPPNAAHCVNLFECMHHALVSALKTDCDILFGIRLHVSFHEEEWTASTWANTAAQTAPEVAKPKRLMAMAISCPTPWRNGVEYAQTASGEKQFSEAKADEERMSKLTERNSKQTEILSLVWVLFGVHRFRRVCPLDIMHATRRDRFWHWLLLWPVHLAAADGFWSPAGYSNIVIKMLVLSTINFIHRITNAIISIGENDKLNVGYVEWQWPTFDMSPPITIWLDYFSKCYFVT